MSHSQAINFALVAKLNGATVLQSVQSDLGVTTSGNLVTTWADQSGNSNDYTAAGSARPTFGSVSVNGLAAISFDGVANVMTAPLILPAPGTTPTYCWMVLRQNTWVANTGFVSQVGATGAHMVWQSGVTPNILSFEGTTNLTNTAAALGSWVRLETQWQNSTADYLKIGSTNSTSINTGNAASTGNRELGRVLTGVGANFANFDILALMYCSGIPGTTIRNALSSAVTVKYGSSVAV